MSGRLEQDYKLELKIEKILESMPAYANDWYLSLRASDLTLKSCKDYIYKLNNFLNYIKPNDAKEVAYADFTEEIVKKYNISIQKKINRDGSISYTSDSYRNAIWYCLNNFFEYLYETGKIEHNYMKIIKRKRGNNRDNKRLNQQRVLLTKEDFKKILNFAKYDTKYNPVKKRNFAIIKVFMVTGMRCSALTEIDISDLDLDKNELTIIDKGGLFHKYYLSDSVVDSIIDWMNYRQLYVKYGNDTDALFLSQEGKRISQSSIEKMIKEYGNQALGKKISPHKLRAGLCSILYDEKKDIEFVRRVIGHSSCATTQRYIVTEGEERKKSLDIMKNIVI